MRRGRKVEADRAKRKLTHILSGTPSLFNDWAAWEAEQFPQSTTRSRLKHLEKEVGELLETPDDIMEYADAMALLMLAAKSQGFEFTDILRAMRVKLGINKARRWGKPNADGFVEHIRGDE